VAAGALAPTDPAGGRRAVLLALGAFLLVRALVVTSVDVAAGAQNRSLLRLLTKWDGQWYAGISEHGYGVVRQHPDGRLLADYAFFPLYPATERLAASVTGLSHAQAGLLVSLLACVVAAAGIFAVAARVLGRREAVIVVMLWAALPVSVVQTMAYSESLFTALAAWSLHAVLAQRWLQAALLACAAGLTRPVGAAVVIAVVAAAALAWRSARGSDGAAAWRVRRQLVLAVVTAPLGLASYLAWVAHRVDDPAGYFAVTRGWGNGFDAGVAFAGWVVAQTSLASAALLAALAVLAALLVACWRDRLPWPLLVYTVVLVALAFTTSGYFGSKPRYLLPVFPLLFPVAAWLARRPTWVVALALVVATAVSMNYAAVWLLGSGPP
jgi:hypothetical protein